MKYIVLFLLGILIGLALPYGNRAGDWRDVVAEFNYYPTGDQ